MFVPTTRATSQCTLKEGLSFIGRIMVASRQSRSGTVRSQSRDAIWVDTVKRGLFVDGVASKHLTFAFREKVIANYAKQFAAEDSRRYDLANVSLAEIKTAIEQLSFEERAELAAWLHDWKNDEWDEQMKRDIASGKLDDVLREVEEDIKAGRVREMP